MLWDPDFFNVNPQERFLQLKAIQDALQALCFLE